MWWLSELGWAGLEDGIGWPPCRFVTVFCLKRGWAGLKEGWDSAPPFCRHGCLGRGCAELSEPGWAGLKDGLLLGFMVDGAGLL